MNEVVYNNKINNLIRKIKILEANNYQIQQKFNELKLFVNDYVITKNKTENYENIENYKNIEN